MNLSPVETVPMPTFPEPEMNNNELPEEFCASNTAPIGNPTPDLITTVGCVDVCDPETVRDAEKFVKVPMETGPGFKEEF